jgi:hypothetical protein
MHKRSLAILAADLRAEVAVGNDALRQQILLLDITPQPAAMCPDTLGGPTGTRHNVRTRPHGILLAIGLVVGLGSGMALLLQSGSVVRQHPVMAWVSIVLVGIFVVVGGVTWIRGGPDRPDGV